jgi:phosphate transport system permease protein
MAVGLLFFILGYLLFQGGSSLNWAFFTNLPVPTGETGGGMANALLGSAKVLSLATLIGVPIGFLAGVYLAEYAHNFSTYAGGMALGVMMIPIALRSTEEFLRAIPVSLREGSMALGATKAKSIVTVVIPAATRGLISGMMLNLARVAGETAPLLFTALNNQFWSPGWDQPTATLPVQIFTYAISPYNDLHRQAWAAGFMLLFLVLVINVTAKTIVSHGLQKAR